ncbi:MAG: type II CRISPR RNA-guided endonuclease Cas9 [Magnetospirillum sp.]|nr:type II CRISPR RNA-guided endonuclease Cas9 [Magnetospirillum sp.]
MMRRQFRRRRMRRRLLNEALAEAGLLPPFDSSTETEWHAVMKFDPYPLRKRSLTERLAPFELGRALYHLAQRRQFSGRELVEDDAPEAAEDKAERDGRATVLAALKTENITLGAWLADRQADAVKGRPPTERRRRDHPAHRSIIRDEFEKIWREQSRYHPVLRDPSFSERIGDIIFAQRPVFWRTNTLGECRFMPGHRLCPKGAWLSRQRRMLEKLNNLTLAGGNARPLDPAERAAILNILQNQGSMSWSKVRSALAPFVGKGNEKRLKFNLEVGGERGLLGNPLEAKFLEIFGPDWHSHPHRQAIRDAVHERLWAADYGTIGTPAQRVIILPSGQRERRRDEAAQSFITDFRVTEAQAKQLRDLTFPGGWEPYSTEALRLIMPHLEKGIRFGALVNGPEWEAWRNETFPNRARPTGEILDRLPSPAVQAERNRLKTIRNPTVARIQNELRKVVNNLIDRYGKPDLIRVEMAREVGKSKIEREEMQSGQRKQARRREDARKDLIAKGIPEPSRDDIEKWLLWKESGERCPYTGDQIGFDALFREGRFEVEHIWPRWVSFDDSFGNKTLCRKDINTEKSNRTPYEYFQAGGRQQEWENVKTRLDAMLAQKGGPGMSAGKIKRFLAEKIPDDFASRQLNDTSYAVRQTIASLRRLWPDVGPEAPVTVQAVTGRVTAQLRKLWCLNNILSESGEKTRADHRHHAIDALTVACAHPGLTQILSRYWQERDDPTKPRPQLPRPWANIRTDAEKAIEGIVVSHRARKKVSGPLHEEMPLGYTGRDVTKNGVVLGLYVKSMPVEKLSAATLEVDRVEDLSRSAKFVVRDKAVRTALREHLRAAGGKPEKAYPPYPRVSPGGPEIRKARVLTLQQKHLMVPVANGYADPANNHHIAIYRKPDGEVDCEVVTLCEAAKRLSRCEPVIRRTHPGGGTFVMSLAAGEAIRFPDGERKGIWIVTGIWADKRVVLEAPTDAAHATTTRPTASSLLAARAEKVSIDPIGRIRRARD